MQASKIFIATVLGLVFTLPAFAEDYVPNEVLIKWKDEATLPDELSTVRVSDVPTAVSLFSQDERVEYVEPNYRRYLAAVPNDPSYGDQWYFDQTNDHDIDAETAWDTTTGSADIVVAVIDTGVDINHPDLIDNLWVNPGEIADNGIDDDGNGYTDDIYGWDFMDSDNDVIPLPESSDYVHDYVTHGTHVAGTIGAATNNAAGVSGINWNVSIMSLKIFDDDGFSDTEVIAEAVAYAVANGADIINMSYGGTGRSQTEQASMSDASDAGVVLVAAAGNEATNLNNEPFYPACFNDVIGVGATDDNDDITYFSNFGDDCVDLAAPGLNIYNTYYYDDTGAYLAGTDGFDELYGYMSGTSMATPVVSGIAALALSVDSGLSTNEVYTILTSTADDIGDSRLGAGRVNAAASVASATDYAAPDPVEISAYRSSSNDTEVADSERTRDKQPYFSWGEPRSPSSVVGYYVYFGRERLDPVTNGVLQTVRNYTPTEDLHGNERNYRLRVKTLDSEGLTSDLGQFIYTVDRRIQRPTWNSVNELSSGDVELRWYRPTGEHVVAYKVYRATDRSGQYESLSGRITTKKYIDTTAKAGERYYYKVKAIDDLGNLSEISEIETIKL